MLVISINHYVLIPFVFDRKKYLLYAVLLFLTIYLGIQLKAHGGNLAYTVKVFLIYTYITGTGMAAFFYRRAMVFQQENDQKVKLQKEMELNYLKEQVNPHFLFNALNSIYALSKSQSPETPELVMQLSELMRYQLESAKKEKVLLTKELEFIENYLLLEEKRLSERCTIELDIQEGVPELYVAPMILIPFVENAIKHGAQKTNDKSSIEISAFLEEARFHFSVINSKPKQNSPSSRKGLGLENVKKRLILLYPKKHVLDISDGENTYEIKLSINLN